MKMSDVAITLILRDSLGCPSFDCLGNSTGCLCNIIGFLKWRFLISHSWSRGTHGSASWDVFLVLLYVLARLILEEIEKKKNIGVFFLARDCKDLPFLNILLQNHLTFYIWPCTIAIPVNFVDLEFFLWDSLHNKHIFFIYNKHILHNEHIFSF